jgi:curli biogenesis system outer membrane secretion channel CsgG
MKRLALAAVLAAVWLIAGCVSKGTWAGDNPDDFVRPTIAVMKFESRAAGNFGWNLGDGMREVLVDRLMATGRYHVVERQELAAVTAEHKLQESGVTRPEGRISTNRLKNCQYLIKGVVTDFGYVSRDSANASLFNWSFFDGSHKAVMGVILYVVDVESGEIIASESIHESVRAKDSAVQADYKNVSFGGATFYQTPLGQVAAKVIDQAVMRITGAIAAAPWEPAVALVQDDGSVVINGGRDRGIKAAARFEVLAPGQPIIDPMTGDSIGLAPGKYIGHIEVFDVQPRYSLARVVSGQAAEFAPGSLCRPMKAPPVLN